MNALNKIVFTAGQKTHENVFGASINFPRYANMADEVVPCAHTEIVKDFDLMPGGKSPKLFIDTLTFRAELMKSNVPEKGHYCTLTLADGSTVNLMLWHGGLQPGAQIYKFMAVDKNYKA